MKIFYQRHLPHYQPPGCTFFVTFRLTGSLPFYVIQKLKAEHEAQLKLISGIEDQKVKKEQYRNYQTSYFEKFDSILDKYRSKARWLIQHAVAEKVKEAIHFRDGNEYGLIAYTIMPNHVHMVFSLLVEEGNGFVSNGKNYSQNINDRIVGRTDCSTYIVTDILKSLKWYTAKECNKILNRSGAFWQHESYDHVVRDEDELSRIVKYVLNNPVKAGLVDKWEDWKWSYCKFVSSD